MAITGRKPTDEATRRNRAKPVHDWWNVVEVPYDGPKPRLPAQRTVVTKEGVVLELKIDPAARRWWSRVSSMPHCVLWAPSDWEFALATALLVDMLYRGDRQAAGEIRLREKTLGTTFEARRDLRIRYVPADTEESSEPAAAPRQATVSHLDERRRRLTGAS